MRRLLLIPLLLLTLGFEFRAFGTASVGTVTVTRKDFQRYELVTFAFVANASGSAVRDIGLSGRVVKVITNPDSGTAPSANWDLYFYDAEDSAVSLTLTALENRHTSNTEVVYPLIAGSTGTVSSVPPVAMGNYAFTVANAGSGGIGRVLVYLER